MPKKTFTPEQMVAKLRQIEVLLSQGKTAPLACKDGGIAGEDDVALRNAHHKVVGVWPT